LELRVIQKAFYYDLLLLKTEYEKEGTVKGLVGLINKTKATMEAEDVAYVEKMIEELD